MRDLRGASAAAAAMGRAAGAAGVMYAHYRPHGGGPALAASSYLGRVPAMLERAARRSAEQAVVLWHATLDTRAVLVGDCLRRGEFQAFVVEADEGRPAVCVEANALLGFFIAGAPRPGGYGGFDFDTAASVAVKWPAAVWRTGAPADAKGFAVRALLPDATPAVRPGMVAVDSDQRVFEVTAAIRGGGCWRADLRSAF